MDDFALAKGDLEKLVKPYAEAAVRAAAVAKYGSEGARAVEKVRN
jgi:hypothetical protein